MAYKTYYGIASVLYETKANQVTAETSLFVTDSWKCDYAPWFL